MIGPNNTNHSNTQDKTSSSSKISPSAEKKPYPEDFWNYLSLPQQDLLIEGDYLKDQVIQDSEYSFKDYSFLVFPFAKAYEGYLKQVFLDVGFITHLDYISDHFRVGKVLSPHMVDKLGDRSVYVKVQRATTEEFAHELWSTWRLHRNEVFHYYPHNLKSISFEEADLVAKKVTETMRDCYKNLLIKVRPDAPQRGIQQYSPQKMVANADSFEQWKK